MMPAATFQLAECLHQAVDQLASDEPAPLEARKAVRLLVEGTIFEAWFVNRQPTGRELLVACGQIAASRGQLSDVLTALARDCRCAENAPCPEVITHHLAGLLARLPRHGSAPALRAYAREIDLFLAGVQEVSVVATVAAGLASDPQLGDPNSLAR